MPGEYRYEYVSLKLFDVTINFVHIKIIGMWFIIYLNNLLDKEGFY